VISDSTRGYAPYRAALACVLLAWLWNSCSLLRWYVAMRGSARVVDHYFPSAFAEPRYLLWAYGGPIVLGAVAFIAPARRIRILHAIALVCGSAWILLQQATHATQFANTSLWLGLWLLWYGQRHDLQEAAHRRKAAVLAQLIIGVIFLGAAVGKWTNGYWSGAVFYDLLFAHEPYPQYVWISDHFEPAQVKEISTWYSRAVVIGESVMACIALAPPRIALPTTVVMVLGMWLGATPRIFDAIGPVLGLGYAGTLIIRSLRREQPSNGR